MNYKYIMRQDISVQIPAWVVLELWEILSQIDQRNTTEYVEDDIKELLSIINQKVNAIQNATGYQRDRFGKSKYDL